MLKMDLKAEIKLFPFQPAGAAPVEHRAPSEGGGRQQAGQADALPLPGSYQHTFVFIYYVKYLLGRVTSGPT